MNARSDQSATIAGASGIALFVFLFFDWFGPFSAWEFFDIVDIVLAAIGLGAALLAFRAMSGQSGPGDGTIWTVDGIVATTITLTFILEGVENKIGLWLAFFASLGLLYAGITARGGGPARVP